MQDEETAIARQLTRKNRRSELQPDQPCASAQLAGLAVELAASGTPTITVFVQETVSDDPEGWKDG